MTTSKQGVARFDAKLSKAHKELFERAAILGGYRNLTEFIMRTAYEKAKKVIEENERVIASQRDNQIFLDALLSPPSPNAQLETSMKEYKQKYSK